MTRSVIWLVPAFMLSTGLFAIGILLGALSVFGIKPFGSTHFTLEAFATARSLPGLWASVALTLMVGIVSTVISTGFGLGLALLLRTRSRVMTLLSAVNIAVPHLVMALATSLFLAQSGLVARLAYSAGWIAAPAEFPILTNDPWSIGIIIAYILKEAPFVAVIALSELALVGRGPELVARSLGASRRQAFIHVVWPQISPSIMAAAAVIFAFTIGAYEVPAILGASHPKLLPVLGYELFSSGNIGDRPAAILLAISTAMAGLLLLGITIWLVKPIRRIR